jgi:hypothetical protein
LARSKIKLVRKMQKVGCEVEARIMKVEGPMGASARVSKGPEPRSLAVIFRPVMARTAARKPTG